MGDEKALVPIEQKSVEFYGDELMAARADDGHVYVSVAQMCGALGIDTQAQTRRIRRHLILADGFRGVANLATPGGRQTAYMLRVDAVPLWLSGIRTSAVSEDIRPKLERFQREAAKVLWEAFQEGRLTADPAFSDLLESDLPAAQAYKMARAMMELARNQLLLESRLDTQDTRLDDHERRLEEVEATLGDSARHVTPDQASQISQAVKTVAMKLSRKSGRNEYGGVYGELYRKFGITSYKQLPAAKFDEAISWLNEWRESIEGDVPF
jgi:ferritin-like metal-binding protein YciE